MPVPFCVVAMALAMLGAAQKWYVASGGDDQYWTFEAAIPLSELAPKVPQGRDAWSIGIQRIIPNIGQQSLTQPSSIPERGETFGLMVFE